MATIPNAMLPPASIASAIIAQMSNSVNNAIETAAKTNGRIFWLTVLAIILVGLITAALTIWLRRSDGQLHDLIKADADARIHAAKAEGEKAKKDAADANRLAGEANDRAGKAQERAAALEKSAEEARKETQALRLTVADANARAEEAKTIAEGFRLDIAKANERAAHAVSEAARFNEIAERERLARVKLEAQLAPRRLTEEQRSKLRAELTNQPRGPLQFASTAGDAEARLFAEELLKFFRDELGYPVKEFIGSFTWFDPTAPAGIAIKVKNEKNPPAHGIPLLVAFNRAGFPVEGSRLDIGEDLVWIEVSAKPRIE